ncbi:MAG: TRAP transporter small permease subunit [Myxococcales bacterium]|nr:TRAP transporter small permease subunit [Myxococcales bacterium]
MGLLARLNQGLVVAERRATVGLLLFVVVLAGVQALIRNAVRYEWSWAKVALQNMLWVDSVLGQACFVLIFLGASLATTAEKHTAIDIIVVHVAPRPRLLMRAISRTCAGLITLALSYSFAQVVLLIMSEYPLDLAVLGPHGPIHVCDGTSDQLTGAPGLTKPWLLCALRAVTAALALQSDTFSAMVKAFVPLLLFVSGLRLLSQGIAAGREFAGR